MHDREGEGGPKRRRTVVWTLGEFFFFKYWNFIFYIFYILLFYNTLCITVCGQGNSLDIWVLLAQCKQCIKFLFILLLLFIYYIISLIIYVYIYIFTYLLFCLCYFF